MGDVRERIKEKQKRSASIIVNRARENNGAYVPDFSRSVSVVQKKRRNCLNSVVSPSRMYGIVVASMDECLPVVRNSSKRP